MSFQVFCLAFIISYLGSIPPGTINITAMQMAIGKQTRSGIFFALAASLTELVYAGITVRFQIYLQSRPFLTENFLIISALAMIGLGLINLSSSTKSENVAPPIRLRGRSGFKKGVMLGLLNPLTIPFWLAVTAYFQHKNWVNLDAANFWFYVIGISLGTFALLLSVLSLGKQFTRIADNVFWVHKVPGLIFMAMGLYNLIDWIW